MALRARRRLRAGAQEGKLPGDVARAAYDLEYGSATIEVTGRLAPGDRVLVVDDVLATGGTAAATVDLVRRCGAEVVGLSVLMELTFLRPGRAPAGCADLQALLDVLTPAQITVP